MIPTLPVEFDYIRRKELVDDHGRGAFQGTRQQAIVSVQPATERTYEMFPDCARVRGAMELYTTTPLTATAEGLAADEVIWQKKTYVVQGITDWSNFGSGYYVALIALKSLLDTQPGTHGE